MCNDYERHIEWEKYTAAIAAAQLGLTTSAGAAQLPPADDTRVNDIAPVMIAAGNAVDLVPMRWGFSPARPGGPPVFNFRSEGRSFASSRRCLIPASAFFEFTGKQSPKTKWRFELLENPVFAVAGLWRSDESGAAFTMLTTAPGPDVAPFHNRQVAVLPPADWSAWLYLECPEADLLRALPEGFLSVSLSRAGKERPDQNLMNRASKQTST